MIAKGTPHQDGAILARYLVTGKERERAELWELRGFASSCIVDAFRSVHVMAAGTRCHAPFFHVYVRNPDGESLERSEWEYTANCIERMLGLTDQPRAIAFHTTEDGGHSHMHVAWSRIDQESLTARPLPFFKQRLKKVSRELEKRFGLTPVPNERQSSIRYAPTRAEEEQARRLGLDIHATREIIWNCFEHADCGRSFQSALALAELTLARGDRRDFLVVDREGGVHVLGKRVLGVSAAEVRNRLADLQRDRLPTVDEARRCNIGRQGKRDRSWHQHQPQVLELAPLPKGCSRAKNLQETTIENEPRPLSSPREDRRNDEPELKRPATPENVTAASVTAGSSVAVAVPGLTDNPTAAAGPQRFTTVIKSQFRALVKALMGREASPQLQARRRRSGETIGGFRLAARAILRPIVRLPVISHATAFLQDTLSWLHLWKWNENTDEYDISSDPGGTDNNHLSPRL